MKYTFGYALSLLFVFYSFCKGQPNTESSQGDSKPKQNGATTYYGPKAITRTIKQDRKGNIWMAAFDGVFRYDGKAFANMTADVSSARFFSLLEDRKGNLWFGSVGSGVYQYDGKSFRHFTTKDGLINNEIVCIYEDKTGTVWLGANGGVSRYDGKSFQNYRLNGGSMVNDTTGIPFPDFTRPPHEINTIIEDRTGRFWFGTRDNTFVYDGKTFINTTYIGQPFTNVRSIIEDKKGNIWLGGANGLWRYDGRTFTNITQNFVGYIYEDKKGNIWTSSETAQGWALSRYDETSLSQKMPTVTELYPKEGKMIFGILESSDGSIWFGADGAYRYDGITVTSFKQ
ncbi:hypothetical protein GCM10028807_01090 [Spirosoma daeguense]